MGGRGPLTRIDVQYTRGHNRGEGRGGREGSALSSAETCRPFPRAISMPFVVVKHE